MKIIIGAMSEELSKLKDDLNLQPVVGSLINEFISNDGNIVLAWTGIGIVNASAGLSHLLTKYKNVEWVLNVGTAGCIDGSLKQNDFVIVEKASYSTADSTGFGYVYGQLPQMPENYVSDETLVASVDLVLQKLKKNFVLGSTATGDIFNANQAIVDKYAANLPFKAVIGEMECAGYMQTAYLYSTPIAALKIVSDVVGHPEASEDQFDKFLPKAAEQISEVIRELINA